MNKFAKTHLYLFLLLTVTNISFTQSDSLYLRLPDYIYTTTTSRYSIYYNNIYQTKSPEKYFFTVECPVGKADSMKYNLDSLISGVYNLNLSIKDSSGIILESKSTELIVTDNQINKTDTLKILFIGNSLTYAGRYERFAKQFLENSGAVVKLLGTQFYTDQDSIDGIFHEGRSGWKWGTYCTNLTSPFVFGSFPGVDIDRYITESLNGERPDMISIFLGINDLYSVSSTSMETIDAGIDNIFQQWNMGLLIDEFQKTFPNTPIGIILTPPANERLYTWYLQTGDSANAFEYKKKQHRLVQRYIDKYKELAKPNFSMIPIYANIDAYNGYPETNLQHQNSFGYEQIGNSVYGWLKYHLSKWMAGPENIEIKYFSTNIQLSWDYVNGASFYRVSRSEDPYADFVEIGTSTLPSYIDTNISGSTKYFYQVTAVNSKSGEK